MQPIKTTKTYTDYWTAWQAYLDGNDNNKCAILKTLIPDQRWEVTFF